MRQATGLVAVLVLVVLLVAVPAPHGEPPAAVDTRPASPTTTGSQAAIPTSQLDPGGLIAISPADVTNQATTSAVRTNTDSAAGEVAPPFHDPIDPDGQVTYIPCDAAGMPADEHDPACVARWTIFHIAAGHVAALPATLVDPALLNQLLAVEAPEPATDGQPQLLVIDSIGQPHHMGPGRAEIEVVVERAWPTGQLDHLFYQATLTRTPTGAWTVVSLRRT